MLDEFDASGEFLDRTESAAFADAGPTAIAVDRSGGAETARSTTSPPALAPAPRRSPSAPEGAQPRRPRRRLRPAQKRARRWLTDSHGDVYAAAGSFIRIFGPDHAQVKLGPEGKGVEDTHTPLMDLAVDSEGHVLGAGERRKNGDLLHAERLPADRRHHLRPPRTELPVEESFPKEGLGFYPRLRAIAVDPGPGAGKDHLFVATGEEIHEFEISIVKGSGLLNGKFAEGLLNTINIESIAVDGQAATSTSPTPDSRSTWSTRRGPKCWRGSTRREARKGAPAQPQARRRPVQRAPARVRRYHLHRPRVRCFRRFRRRIRQLHRRAEQAIPGRGR